MSEKKELSKKQKYGAFAAIIFGVNSMIGSGIFLLPEQLYVNLGPASIVTIFIDVIVVLLFAFCFADVAGYVDKNGGAYQYAKLAFGKFVGFDVGFLGWVSCVIGWSAMAMGFSELAIALFPNLESVANVRVIIAITLIISLSILNNFGNNISKYIGTTVTLAKLIPLISFSVAALFFIKYGLDHGSFTPFVQAPKGTSFISGLNSNALILFYGFIGFETLPIIAGEVKDPKKNVPKAVILSTLIVSAIYFLIIFGTIAMLGNKTVGGAPVQRAFTMMVGPIGGLIVSVGAIISVGGLNNVSAVSIPRMIQTLSNDSLMPKQIAKENRWGSPYIASIITAVFACLLVLSGTFETLVGLSVLMFFVQYIPTALASIYLRKSGRLEKVAGSFSLPFGNVIPVLAILTSFWILSSTTLPNILFLVSSIIVASVIYYFIHQHSKSDSEPTKVKL